MKPGRPVGWAACATAIRQLQKRLDVLERDRAERAQADATRAAERAGRLERAGRRRD